MDRLEEPNGRVAKSPRTINGALLQGHPVAMALTTPPPAHPPPHSSLNRWLKIALNIVSKGKVTASETGCKIIGFYAVASTQNVGQTMRITSRQYIT